MQIPTLLSIIAIVFAGGNAQQMQINYFSDNFCNQYLGHVVVDWAGEMGTNSQNCYNYQYGGSFMMANCYESFCMCEFYNEPNCSPGHDGVGYSSITFNSAQNVPGSCILEDGSQGPEQVYQSFRCFYA